MSVEEVCRNDANDLAGRVTGTTALFVETKMNVPSCAAAWNLNKDFGILVLMRGSPTVYNLQKQFTQYGGNACPASSTKECRKMACLLNSTFAGYVAGCTGHLVDSANSDSPNAAQQAAEYGIYANSTYGTYARWLGGDFNLTP